MEILTLSFTTVLNRTVPITIGIPFELSGNFYNYSIFNSWMSLSEVHLSLNEQAHHCVSSQSSIMIYPLSNKKSDDFINVRLTMRVNAHRNVVLPTFINNTNIIYCKLLTCSEWISTHD